jgi:hypothetical protein
MIKTIIMALLFILLSVGNVWAQITITFPDGKTATINITEAEALKLVESIALKDNYSPTIKDEKGETIPNPETKEMFALRMTLEWVFKVNESVKSKAGSEAGRLKGIADAEADVANITITPTITP